jgi:hypothetical protein
MPACLVHFCVNAKVTCMLDAYCALVIVRHKHFCCDAIRTKHVNTGADHGRIVDHKWWATQKIRRRNNKRQQMVHHLSATNNHSTGTIYVGGGGEGKKKELINN